MRGRGGRNKNSQGTRPLVWVALLLLLAVDGLPHAAKPSWAAPGDSITSSSANSAASAYFEDALILSAEGELNAVVIQLKNALIKNPDHLAARILLGEAYTRLGYPRAAIEAFETALILGADDDLVVIPLFTAYLMSREYQLILETIELKSRPRALEGELLIIRGHSCLELGNYIDAEKDFNEASMLLPGRGAPLIGKALVFFNRGDYRRAERMVDRAIELSPGEAAGWFVNGEIKRARSLVESAIDNYSSALERDAFHYKARLARAGLLIDSDRLEQAKADLDILQENQPNDPQAIYFRALILLKKGEWQDAGVALNTALTQVEQLDARNKTRHPQYTLLAGVVRLLNGDQEQAWRLLSDYVDAVPDDPVGRIILGRIFLMRDEPATALSFLTPVLRLNPDSPEIYALLGSAYMRLEDFAKAADFSRSGHSPGRENHSLAHEGRPSQD